MTSKSNQLPPALVSNLQDVLMKRKGGGEGEVSKAEERGEAAGEKQEGKPIILVTNSDGIESPGLTALVGSLVGDGRWDVHVCAPASDKSLWGHSLTLRETVSVTTMEISGAAAYEVSGAREALLSGIPSLSISLDWKQDTNNVNYLKEVATICLPLISAAIRDIEKDIFPKKCSLVIQVPSSPSVHKGFKITKHSEWRSVPAWQPVTHSNYPAGHFMSKNQSLGIQLAQLGRDASAAGAARRVNAQKKTVEIESVAESGKPEPQRGNARRQFRLEFVEKQPEDHDEDLDFKAVENGFISVTPLHLQIHCNEEIHTAASEWLTACGQRDQSIGHT